MAGDDSAAASVVGCYHYNQQSGGLHQIRVDAVQSYMTKSPFQSKRRDLRKDRLNGITLAKSRVVGPQQSDPWSPPGVNLPPRPKGGDPVLSVFAVSNLGARRCHLSVGQNGPGTRRVHLIKSPPSRLCGSGHR